MIEIKDLIYQEEIKQIILINMYLFIFNIFLISFITFIIFFFLSFYLFHLSSPIYPKINCTFIFYITPQRFI